MVYNDFVQVKQQIDNLYNSERLYVKKFNVISEFIKNNEFSGDVAKQLAEDINQRLETYASNTRTARTFDYLSKLGETVSEINDKFGYKTNEQTLADILKDSKNNAAGKNVFIDKTIQEGGSVYNLSFSDYTSRKSKPNKTIQYKMPSDAYKSAEITNEPLKECYTNVIGIDDLCSVEGKRDSKRESSGVIDLEELVSSNDSHDEIIELTQEINPEDIPSDAVYAKTSPLNKTERHPEAKNYANESLDGVIDLTEDMVYKGNGILPKEKGSNRKGIKERLLGYASKLKDKFANKDFQYKEKDSLAQRIAGYMTTKGNLAKIGASTLLSTFILIGCASQQLPEIYLSSALNNPSTSNSTICSDSQPIQDVTQTVSKTTIKIPANKPEVSKPKQPGKKPLQGPIATEQKRGLKIGSMVQDGELHKGVDYWLNHPEEIVNSNDQEVRDRFAIQRENGSYKINETLTGKGHGLNLYVNKGNGWEPMGNGESLTDGYQIAMAKLNENGKLDVRASIAVPENEIPEPVQPKKTSETPEESKEQLTHDNVRIPI